MSKQSVIIRCDGGRKIGLGHIMRCLALADMLRADFEISFAIQETSDEVKSLIKKEGFLLHLLPSTEDFREDVKSLLKLIHQHAIIVLDGYNFRSEYQKTIKDFGCKLVCIDDLHAWHHYADIVINHAGGVTEEEYDCEVYTQLFLGFQYALLRKEFLNYQPREKEYTVLSHFFISMGASDLPGNSRKFAEALLHWPSTEKIRIMVSTMNPHIQSLQQLQTEHPKKIELLFNLTANELIEVIENTHLVICPASTIALETCAIGCLLMTGLTATNQESNLTGLVQKELAINLGDLNEIKSNGFLIRLESMFMNPQNAQMLEKQHAVFTQTIGSNMKSLFLEISQTNEPHHLYARTARSADLMLYYDWVNDKAVRDNSFNSGAINLVDHSNWFLNTIKSESSIMYLFFLERVPVGQVRFILNGQIALVNYSIDKNYRGRGLSSIIINNSIAKLRNTHSQIKTIQAELKPENLASIRAFQKNKFNLTGTGNEKIIYQLHLQDNTPLN